MFSFKGRMNRWDFFVRSVVVSIVQFIFNTLSHSYPDNSLTIFMALVAFVVSIIDIIFIFSITVRRWHDLGKSGWWSILNILPLINLFVGIYLFLKKGDEGSNKYGGAV